MAAKKSKPRYYDVRLGHYSLKATATPAQVGAIMEEVVRRDRLDGFSGTEARGGEKRRAIQSRLGRKWVTHTRGEYPMGWKRSVFKGRGPGALRQFGDVYPDSGGDWWRDLFVHSRPIKHKPTGKKIHWSDLHGAGGTQAGRKFKAGLQSQAWRRGLEDFGRWLRGIKVFRLVSGDWNVDLLLQIWRDRVEDRIGLDFATGDRTYRWGTHGHRMIDGWFVDGDDRDIEVIGLERSKVDRRDIFDHVGVIITLRIWA